MARGWESKSVESQQESARDANTRADAPRSDEEKQTQREKQSLLLSRAYVRHQIELATNQAYADSLRQALAEIEHKLASLDGKG
jgi:septal ring factor EnvC (AmiA/AmiB activator)